MMKGVPYLVTMAILALAFSLASAYDPSPLQDFCVAINNTDSAGTYMLSSFFFFLMNCKSTCRSLLAVRSSVIITYFFLRSF